MTDTPTADAITAAARNLITEVQAATYPMPVQAARANLGEGPIPEALAYAVDRIDRLEHVLGDLNGVVMRAGTDLAPVLTGGTYTDTDDAPPMGDEPTPEDRRSTIARRIGALGSRVDGLADATTAIRHRLEAILDAVEL